ncbi:SMI1/KNR4 family protein [Pseudoalteromonas sp. HM-SA03]|nr:SMI1/KNR4 family protein [Pseudoalteromonas sp. HM-SA03]
MEAIKSNKEQKVNIIWEEYVDPPLQDISSTEISTIEAIIGFILPADYKSFIVDKQGLVPSKEVIESNYLAPTPFGPLFHVLENCSSEHILYSALEKFNKWKDLYPNIFPIADAGSTGNFFAYNFKIDHSNPPIIFVNVEEDPDAPEAFIHVSKDINELLNNLKD